MLLTYILQLAVLQLKHTQKLIKLNFKINNNTHTFTELAYILIYDEHSYTSLLPLSTHS